MGSLVREYRHFPTGDTFKTTETVNNITDDTSVILSNTGPFYQMPPPGSDFDYCVYSLAFWNVGGKVSVAESVNVTIKGTTVVTGWYTHSCYPGGETTPTIRTYAFDADANADMSGTTPIEGVTPPESWTPGSNSVTPSTQDTITIDAKNSVDGKGFKRWLVFGAGTPSNDDVIIPPDGSGFYVAIYKEDEWTPKVILPFLVKWWERWQEELHESEIPGGRPPGPTPWDPVTTDIVRLKHVASLLSARGELLRTDPAVLDAAEARKELTRVNAEIKRLEAAKKTLKGRIDK